MRRRLLFAIGCLAVLLVLADTAAWWVVTGRMRAEVLAWQQARQAEGYTVTSGEPSRAGWPLRAEVLIPAMTIGTDAPGQPDAAAWQAGDMRLVLSPFDPGQVTVLLDGTQTIRFGAAPPLSFDAALLDLVVPLTASGQADGVRLNARSVAIGSGGVRSLSLRLAGQAVDVVADGLNTGAGPVGVLDQVHVTVAASTPIPPLRDPASAARAWRDAGGTLTVSQFALRWGALDMAGSATLRLDPALQPVGAGTVRIAGFKEASDTLVHAGLVTHSQAQVAVTLLTLMSRPGPDGAPAAELPLRVEGGVVYAGAVPLLRLPVLAIP